MRIRMRLAGCWLLELEPNFRLTVFILAVFMVIAHIVVEAGMVALLLVVIVVMGCHELIL